MENLMLLAEVAVRLAEEEEASTLFLPPHNIASSSHSAIPPDSWPKRKRSPKSATAADSRKIPVIYFHPKVKKIRAKKIKKPFRARANQPESPVSAELRGKIAALGGTKIKLVINKEIHWSDIDRSQTRLSMPRKQAGDGFLDENDKTEVGKGIPVKLLEPCGKITEMELKIWKLLSSENYVVKAGASRVTWREVVEREENKDSGVFVEGQEVRVWSFRVEGQLWLAIEKVEGDEANNGGGQVIN